MDIICTICARGGSKEKVNKHLASLLGKPLIAHTIIQAKASRIFSCCAVSSDCPNILSEAKRWGADLLIERPPVLASDTAAKIPAIRHCVEAVEKNNPGRQYSVVVDLDASSPLRSVDDIRRAVTIFLEADADNLVTGMVSRRSPYFNMVELDSSGRPQLCKSLDSPIVRRQDSPRCFDLNASVYVWKREILDEKDTLFNENTLFYEMPVERSIDIDSEIDFEIVRFFAEKRGGVVD